MPDASAKLKRLKRELRLLQDDRAAIIQRHREITTERSRVDRGIETVQNKIEALKRRGKSLIVSEHALLRYIERVMGVDLEDLKNEILTDDVLLKIKALQGCDGVYPSKGGFQLRVKDNTVVTILTRGRGNGAA
jgi:chromosome segregation ATPase